MTTVNSNPITEHIHPVSSEKKLTLSSKLKLGAMAVVLLGIIISTSASTKQTELQLCQEQYMQDLDNVYKENAMIAKQCIREHKNDIFQLNECTSNPIQIPENKCQFKSSMNATGGTAPVPPKSQIKTLRSEFGLADCRFVNSDHRIKSQGLDWYGYDIACEVGKSFDIKSPGKYTIVNIGYRANEGDFIVLRNDKDFRIVLAHTQTSRKIGDVLHRGDIIGQTNLSGLTTGMHVHIELWDGYMNLTSAAIYSKEYDTKDQSAVLNYRKWDFGQTKKEHKYYFTAYNLGDPAQNDSTPCIGASGKDLCHLEWSGIRTMAVTSDIRKALNLKWGDKVILKGEPGCEGTYQVEDEMNIRYRQTPGIKRPGTDLFIKGDIPSKQGGACTITKL